MRWNWLPSLHYDYDCLQHTCIPALTDPSSGKRPAAALSAAGQLAVVGGAGARPFASCRLRPARRCAAREPGGAREPGRRARHLPAHQGAVGRHQCRGRAGRDVPSRTGDRGQIAIDDDHDDAGVFALFRSGHRLIAKPATHVARGAPLFAVAASEFVQGQNDLVTAVASLKTARGAAQLAQANEKRQHELYQAKAARSRIGSRARSIWRPPRTACAAPEIALAAVRNRLRILGKSDEEIDAIEDSATQRASSRSRSCRADRRHRDPAPGRARPDTSSRSIGRQRPRSTRSAICRRSGWSPMSARRMRR